MNSNDDSQPQDAVPPTASFRVVSTKGRIGRLRMMAYPIGLSFLIMLPFFLLLIIVPSDSAAVVAGTTVVGLVYLVMNGIWTVRRVQDFNGPIWVSAIFVLTMVFLPIVNVILWLIPGTDGENRYGQPPPPNGPGVGLLAFLMPVVAIVGILAAIAIPAYQNYTLRALVQESANISNPHRTALERACREGEFRAGLSNVHLGLSEPSEYGSKYVESVAVTGIGPHVAEVVLTFRAIGAAIKEGQTVVYIGTCRSGEIGWDISGSISDKFFPMI